MWLWSCGYGVDVDCVVSQVIVKSLTVINYNESTQEVSWDRHGSEEVKVSMPNHLSKESLVPDPRVLLRS